MHKNYTLSEDDINYGLYTERHRKVNEQIRGKQDERYENLVRRFALEYMKRGCQVNSTFTIVCRKLAAELTESLRELRQHFPEEADETLETAVQALLEMEDWEDIIVAAVKFGLRMDADPYSQKKALGAFGLPVPEVTEDQKHQAKKSRSKVLEKSPMPGARYYGMSDFEDLVRTITKAYLERGMEFYGDVETDYRFAAGILYGAFEDARIMDPNAAEQALSRCVDVVSAMEETIEGYMIARNIVREIDFTGDWRSSVYEVCEKYKGKTRLMRQTNKD